MDVRIGEAAEMLGVSVETLRRWERERQLRTVRTSGGQRSIPLAEVTRLLAERRRDSAGAIAMVTGRTSRGLSVEPPTVSPKTCRSTPCECSTVMAAAPTKA